MHNSANPRIGILGATGAVGRELIWVLHERKFPMETLNLYASERSAGKTIETPFGSKVIKNADKADYSALDLAFFAIGGGWPAENAQKAQEAGCTVIDSSSTFRYNQEVPLVIPEINSDAIGDSQLIANPNCTTAIAAIPLWVIYKNFGIRRAIISTYQATSGAGAEGMRELETETKNYLEGNPVQNKVFQHPIPFNTIPHIDKFQENAYTKEEMKVVWETRKIFGDASLKISCTAVRIPTMRAHGESVVAETEKPIDANEFRKLLEQTEGVTIRDDPANNKYPMPLSASNSFGVEVGRIRKNLVFGEHGIEFFVCGDQLLKGAALNAVQIAEAIR